MSSPERAVGFTCVVSGRLPVSSELRETPHVAACTHALANTVELAWEAAAPRGAVDFDT